MKKHMNPILRVCLSLCLVMVLVVSLTTGARAAETFTVGDYTYYLSDGVAVIDKYNGTDTVVTVPTEVELGGRTYKVRTIDEYAFEGNDYIVTLVIPVGITKINKGAFKNCTFISSITINGDIGDTHGSSANSGNWQYYSDYSVFYNAGANAASLTVTFGEGVTRVPAYLFATGSTAIEGKHAHITSVVLSNSVTEIGSYAFNNCHDLTSVTCGTELKTIGERAFYAIPAKSIEFGAKLEKIDKYAFENSFLETLVLPASVKQLGNGAFKNCTFLSEITINGDIGDCSSDSANSRYDQDNSVFFNAGANADSLTVTFAEGVTMVPEYLFATASDTTEGKFAHVTSVVMADTVTGIDVHAFDCCYDLVSVTLSKELVAIGYRAFRSVPITSIEFGDKLEWIGQDAFRASGLVTVTLPSSVTQLYRGAFAECANLSSVTINSDIADCDSGSGSSYNHSECAVFYKAGSSAETFTVTFGPNVTKVPAYLFATGSTKADGNYARVTDVVLHEGILTVGESAFANCHDLARVTYQSTSGSETKMDIKEGNAYLQTAVWTTVWPDGWGQIGRDWYYFVDQVPLTGWQEIDGLWYYFNTDGIMQTGWIKVGKSWYYMNEKGAMQTGWVKVGGTWYYLNKSGVMQTGWQKIGGVWYYFKSGGAMATGWVQSGKAWYYMKANGAMSTGWVQDGGKWFYMNASGVMQTGWLQIGGKWFYMNASGVMQTGWVKVSGSWYYMNANGVMQTGWLKLDGKWYYLKSGGAMVTGSYVIGGKTYYFDANGVWIP